MPKFQSMEFGMNNIMKHILLTLLTIFLFGCGVSQETTKKSCCSKDAPTSKECKTNNE